VVTATFDPVPWTSWMRRSAAPRAEVEVGNRPVGRCIGVDAIADPSRARREERAVRANHRRAEVSGITGAAVGQRDRISDGLAARHRGSAERRGLHERDGQAAVLQEVVGNRAVRADPVDCCQACGVADQEVAVAADGVGRAEVDAPVNGTLRSTAVALDDDQAEPRKRGSRRAVQLDELGGVGAGVTREHLVDEHRVAGGAERRCRQVADERDRNRCAQAGVLDAHGRSASLDAEWLTGRVPAER
jgi:hypothetical protein